jgi:hypothetical protein
MIFPSPAGMSLTKLSLAENNLIIRSRGVWLVTSRLATGKSLTFFTVHLRPAVGSFSLVADVKMTEWRLSFRWRTKSAIFIKI